MSKPIIIEKYRDLPKKIQKGMKGMGIKFSQLKSVKKVYWGAYILVFREEAGFTLKIEDMVKHGVISVEDIGIGISIAIKPKMEEHDMVQAKANIIGGVRHPINRTIPKGERGTIVTPIDNRGICLVEFCDNTVVDVIAEDEIELII